MLERATACFESAGRRLFRDSNDAIRSRKSLSRNFWKHNSTTDDFPTWFLALVQSSSQRPSSALNLASRNQTQSAHDGGTPFLEFLYPKSSHPSLRISRQSRRLGLRRRRRPLVGFPRTYTSEAVPHAEPFTPDTHGTHGTNIQRGTEDPVGHAIAELSRILESKGKDFDKAWVLYLAAGKPSAVRSEVCQYLTVSKQSSDSDRAWQVFEEIPLEDRSPSDFHRICVSLIRQENSLRLNEITRLARSPATANECFPLIFAYFWKREMWTSAVEAWQIGSSLDQQAGFPLSQLFFSRLTATSLLWKGLEFGKYLLEHPDERSRSAIDLGNMFLTTISQSPKHPEHAPLDALLETLRVYQTLGIQTEDHYHNIIDTLQSSSTRSGFSRTIVFYRHLRVQDFHNYRPPYKLIDRQLTLMNTWDMTNGILYFLAELEHFHRRPGMGAYLASLDCFAHAGDVSQVETLFNRMRADHGIPSDCRPALPLLVAHAENGNVKETRRQFQRLSDEFNLRPNTHCWNVLIKAHATNNDWNGARKTFNQMLDEGLKPDPYTFGTLMGITAKRGDIDGTRQLLSEARQHQVQITMPMLDTIIQVYCRNGQLDFAEQLAEACSSLQIAGSATRIWNTIQLQYARRLDVRSCKRIRKRMGELKVAPDAWTYYAAMLGLVLIGRPDRARRMLRELHKQRRMYAEEDHYALILSGYVEERNRDMVHVVFREIVERFGKAGPKSSLLYLKTQVHRDLQIAKETGVTDAAELHLVHAEKALAESLATSHAASPQSTSKPVNQPADDTAALLQYEYLIKEYGKHGAIERARVLYQELMDRRAPVDPQEEPEPMPLEVLTAMMSAHLNVAEYKEAGELWKLALSEAMEKASHTEFDTFPHSQASSLEKSPSPKSRTPDSLSADSFLPRNGRKILAAQRFILAKPLSLYMRVLGYQNQTSKIGDVVAELEKLGFALTTFNLSSWVQMLASSDFYPDQLKAFRMFEEKFAPLFPGWYKLLRGYGQKSPEMTKSTWMLEDHRTESFRDVSGKTTRKHWLSIEPDHLQPTYLTVVFLAASLNRVRDRTISQGNHEIQKICAVAPRTVQLIGEMPYKRDKFQGVLLRHRSQQTDKEKNPIEHLISTGGVLGKGKRSKRRPDIFKDDETLETWQPKVPKHLRKKDGDFISTEKPADTLVSEDPGVNTQSIPMSRADQIDTESHIRQSGEKQKKHRQSQFARVVGREMKRRDVTRQYLKSPNKQTPIIDELSVEELQVGEEQQFIDNEKPNAELLTQQQEEQEHSQAQSTGNGEEFESEVECAKRPAETLKEMPDETKARE